MVLWMSSFCTSFISPWPCVLSPHGVGLRCHAGSVPPLAVLLCQSRMARSAARPLPWPPWPAALGGGSWPDDRRWWWQLRGGAGKRPNKDECESGLRTCALFLVTPSSLPSLRVFYFFTPKTLLHRHGRRCFRLHREVRPGEVGAPRSVQPPLARWARPQVLSPPFSHPCTQGHGSTPMDPCDVPT